MICDRRLRLVLVSMATAWCCALGAPRPACAQPVAPDPFDPDAPAPPAPTPTPAGPGAPPAAAGMGGGGGADGDEVELTPEELAEIERATGADAQSLGRAGSMADTGGAAPLPIPVPDGAAAFLPDISIVLDAALAAFSMDEPLQSGGHDPSHSGFNLQQLELSLGKSVDPYFRFDSNLVFLEDGVEIEEAYATTLDLPANLQLRAGKFLTRFGRINGKHPHAWDFVDQPFFWSKALGGDGNRGLGAELSVLLPLPWYVEIAGSTTQADGADTARSFYGGDDQGIHSPLDFENLLALKQFFELGHDWSLFFGVTAATGPNPFGRDTRTDLFGTDLFLKYRPITRASYTSVSVESEWILRRRQVPDDLLLDVGGYAQLAYRFERRWSLAGRYEYGTATVNRSGQPAVDPLDPTQVADRHRAALAVTFHPSEFSRLRLQGSVDVPRWREGVSWGSVFAFEVVAGSHGAHPY